MTGSGWRSRPSVLGAEERAVVVPGRATGRRVVGAAPATLVVDLPTFESSPDPAGFHLPAGDALALAQIGMWSWEPACDRLVMTEQMRRMHGLGIPDRPLRLRDRLRLLHPGDRYRVKDAVEAAWATGQGSETEYRVERGDGSVSWLNERTTVELGSDGRPVRIHGVCRDVTDRREAAEALVAERQRFHQRLAHLANHDPVTDLPNRSLFLDHVSMGLRALGPADSLAVLSVDLDNFKLVNDSLGHEVGDQVLRTTARRLERASGPADTVARFGGDEFVLVSRQSGRGEHVTDMANRLLRVVAEPIFLDGHSPVVVTASIGIAVARSPEARPDLLMRDADSAMHRAKEEGPGRFSFYDEQLHRRASLRLSLGNELRNAVDNGELFLAYQPQFRVSDGQFMGVEALVRWHHPTRGLLAPADWIPVAEETELIVPVGAWVIAEACRKAAQWMRISAQAPGRPPLKVCVNVSAVQLARPELIDAVAEALDDTGIDPSCLCVEITESVLMGAPGMYLEALLGLKLLGVSIAVDDFGTGYSSLAYLRRFPIDVIKIDRGFVDGLHRDDQRGLSIMKAVIQLAEALGVTPVAEGVETAEQAEILAEAGCYGVQGFLYARPQPAEEITELLSRPTG